MPKAKPSKAMPADKRGPGRPRSSELDPTEQARVRRQRHRDRKRDAGMIAAEIWLPEAWHQAVLVRGETLQNAAQEAFGMLIAKWEKTDHRKSR